MLRLTPDLPVGAGYALVTAREATIFTNTLQTLIMRMKPYERISLQDLKNLIKEKDILIDHTNRAFDDRKQSIHTLRRHTSISDFFTVVSQNDFFDAVEEKFDVILNSEVRSDLNDFDDVLQRLNKSSF